MEKWRDVGLHGWYFFKNCTGDQVVDDEIGGSYSTNDSEGKCMQGFGGET